MSRVQLALNVADIDEAVAFYSAMFATEAHKRRPGYANFEVADPPLKLVLFEVPDRAGSLNHLGVEVQEVDEVSATMDRFESAGLNTLRQGEVECCFSVQDKGWVHAPDGQKWEVYAITDDQNDGSVDAAGATEPAEADMCCGPTDCC
jgi:catechol 2,3-dioxygenase-like lactoylglutathione lyase family enzyme